jgi:hypothetical protein
VCIRSLVDIGNRPAERPGFVLGNGSQSRRQFGLLLVECREPKQSMIGEKRKARRVIFERGIPVHMMAIDGTWRRACLMEDVSDTGAKLTIGGSVEGIDLKEFFLLLSSTGLAYRRCQLAWVNGQQIGVTFLKQADSAKSRAGQPRFKGHH